MKRLVPLWICALGGFVLIVAYFIPATQGWGEIAAIWFDILAAIAFILGGGNLLKMHLKKASDRASGWGYSVVTALSFLIMLYVGLVKWGAPPATNQEFFGETFVELPLESVPVTFAVPGTLPVKVDRSARLHHVVRRQIDDADGQITFRGWMRGDQKIKLLAFDESLAWQCAVARLYADAQPEGALAGGLAYYADHEALAFRGRMSQAQRDQMMAMEGDALWSAAVDELYNASQRSTTIEVATLPSAVDPAALPADVSWDAANNTLTVIGPLTGGQRAAMLDVFPIARPLDADARAALLGSLQAAGPLDPLQIGVFNKVLDGSWSAAQLGELLDAAGAAPEVARTPCAMFEDQQAGVDPIPIKEKMGKDVTLNTAQVALLDTFARDESMTVDRLVGSLSAAGDLTGGQEAALRNALAAAPTIGERNRALAQGMMQVIDAQDRPLPLTAGQRAILLDDFAGQAGWETSVGNLFVSAHDVKFRWSGEYRAQGAPFWWLYEYAFKPLQATIFAMLAFYVASAAFRAFRAKNIEAILLLGTAFIILLGRTYAGVYLTSWMPEALSGLKIENMTVYIMKVFNTAGNRAIMIGIALGIASTSLKVLLGVDRSYLGSGDE